MPNERLFLPLGLVFLMVIALSIVAGLNVNSPAEPVTDNSFTASVSE
ncbi:MAG: hypothetical protein ABWZ57_09895 [Mesorhizobium sp.]|jgi:hypothetical protein